MKLTEQQRKKLITYSTVLTDMADQLSNIANPVCEDTTCELDKMRNTCLGYDGSFCLDGETMFEVSTGELVVVGEECGENLVKTFDYNGAYRRAMASSELTHSMYDCWNLLVSSCKLSTSEYRQKYHVLPKSDESVQQAIRRDLVQRAQKLATLITSYQFSGINVYNTKNMSMYQKFSADNLVCPKCGNTAYMCNTNYDGCYFQCDQCGSSHWFTRNSPDEAVDVPQQMRKWDEQVNGTHGEDNV